VVVVERGRQSGVVADPLGVVRRVEAAAVNGDRVVAERVDADVRRTRRQLRCPKDGSWVMSRTFWARLCFEEAADWQERCH
jgi:hypothetical protein